MKKTNYDGSQPLENSRHERIAQLIASGEKDHVAYKQVYENKHPRSAVSRLMATNDNIKGRIMHLKQLNSEASIKTREDILRHMAKIMDASDADYIEQIRAAQELNKMCGNYQSKKVDVSLNPLKEIFEQLRGKDNQRELEGDEPIDI